MNRTNWRYRCSSYPIDLPGYVGEHRERNRDSNREMDAKEHEFDDNEGGIRRWQCQNLCSRIGVCESTHSKTPALGILDRYCPGARPNFRTVASATILLIMKSLKNRLVLLSALVAFPFSLFAGTLQTVTLEVQNMTCAVCPITVKKALERVSGVTDAKVDFEKKTASVSFDPDKATPPELTRATADAGYPSSVHN